MQIQWGIIGAGNVTEVKSGPPLYKIDGSSLVAVMRRNGVLAADYARRHNVPNWYDDAAALINNPEVNAIYIATPPSSHKEYTLMAAAAGKPVYVEKPMALNHAECLEMIEACQVAGVPLYVAYYRRALPRFVQIKSWLESGAIGEVRSVRITLHQPPHDREDDGLPWRVQPEISGGGLFLDVGSHMLDYLDYMLGPVRSVSGYAVNQAGRYLAEDHVVASLEFESGVVGVGDWCFASFESLDRTEIVGSKGIIHYATFDESPLVLINEQGQTTAPGDNPPHVQQPLIQSIVDELNDNGTCPSTGSSAARTTWVMDQLLHEYRQENRGTISP